MYVHIVVGTGWYTTSTTNMYHKDLRAVAGSMREQTIQRVAQLLRRFQKPVLCQPTTVDADFAQIHNFEFFGPVVLGQIAEFGKSVFNQVGPAQVNRQHLAATFRRGTTHVP